jgi:hypothetical protein
VIDDLLETERVVLRRFTEADVNHLVALDADPEVMRFHRPLRRVVLPRPLDDVSPREVELGYRPIRSGKIIPAPDGGWVYLHFLQYPKGSDFRGDLSDPVTATRRRPPLRRRSVRIRRG